MIQPGKANSPGTSQAQAESHAYRLAIGTLIGAVVVAVVVVVVVLQFSRPSDKPPPATGHAPQSSAHSSPATHLGKKILNSILPKAVAPQTPGLTEEQLIAQLLDPKQPLQARRAAARALARLGSENAMEALKSVLQDGTALLKAAVAEVLGECPSPDARPLLLALAHSADESTARGAMRGLAALGDAAATGAISSAMFDGNRSTALRTEAALALGGVQQPAALNALIRAVHEIRDETILSDVLNGLGHHPFAQTEATFREFLNRNDLSSSSRVAAIEALGYAPDNVTPSLLLDYTKDPLPEVRAAVGWALTTADNPSDLRPQLLDWLQLESDPAVRLRLYQALSHQDAVASSAVLPIVQNESAGDARVAGLGLLADTLRADGNPDASRYFDSTAVAELKNIVLTSGRLDQSLAAIMTLDRAGTPAAITALNCIAQHPADPACQAAAQQALKRHSGN